MGRIRTSGSEGPCFVVGVDPGFGNTGVAVVDGRRRLRGVTRIAGRRGEAGRETTEERCASRGLALFAFLNGAGLRAGSEVVVWIEEPEDWSSLRSRIAHRGVVEVKGLALWLTGALWARGWDARLVTAAGWKGQVPKEVMRRRLLAAGYPVGALTHDEVDAVGLALWGSRRGRRGPVPAAGPGGRGKGTGRTASSIPGAASAGGRGSRSDGP